MKIEQFVMAYGAEQDRLRALMPNGFESLRPVLRINAEIRGGKSGYIELNTAVRCGDFKGWLNIARFEDVPFSVDGKTVLFEMPFLAVSFSKTGALGSCPAEKDNDGCLVHKANSYILVPPERIEANKEFCDCSFAWHLQNGGAHGKSTGKTLPAIPTEVKTVYPKQALTAENAAQIPCLAVLGSYTVSFERN